MSAKKHKRATHEVGWVVLGGPKRPAMPLGGCGAGLGEHSAQKRGSFMLF